MNRITFLASCVYLLTVPVCYLALVAQDQVASDKATSHGSVPVLRRDLGSSLDSLADNLQRIAKRDQLRTQYLNGMETGELRLRPVQGGPEFVFRYIPSGPFVLGMSKDERISHFARYSKGGAGRISTTIGFDAAPSIHIRVTRGFFLLTGEITQEQMESLSAPSQESKEAGHERMPATAVTWAEAAAFCKRLSTNTGFFVRLPTELEWEYSARGPFGWAYPWSPHFKESPDGQLMMGNEFYAHAKGKSAREVSPDISKDIAWRGNIDMAGNVSEWCLDIYDRNAYQKLEESAAHYDPLDVNEMLLQTHGPTIGRVYRGGNFADSEAGCHLCFRRDLDETGSSPRVGFRPVLLLAEVQ